METSLRTFIGTYNPLTCAVKQTKCYLRCDASPCHCNYVQVVCIFLGVGAAFVPLGYACLKASRSVRCRIHCSKHSHLVVALVP